MKNKATIVAEGFLAVVFAFLGMLAVDYVTWLLYIHILHGKFHWPYLTFWDVFGLWVLLRVLGNCFRNTGAK